MGRARRAGARRDRRGGLTALLVALGLMAASLSARPAMAAELIVFEKAGCPWCERFEAEIGVAYPKTAEGARAPLRRLDISRWRQTGARLNAPVAVTPTFVLVDGGVEVGRITGYPGQDFFWGLLGELLARLDRREMPVARPAAFAPEAGKGPPSPGR